MEERRNYSIKRNRLMSSYFSGLELSGSNKMEFIAESFNHQLILGKIDGISEDAKWGRLKFDSVLDEGMIMVVYIYATNMEDFNRNMKATNIDEFLLGDDDFATKKKFFELVEAKKIINQNDILLYDLEGRYLHILIEITGCGAGYIENMSVNSQGDFFMESLPEVYQEYDSFLHRYLSIFSSLYIELQEKIENFDEIFDLDKAPVNALVLFGKWLGIDVSGNFLSENKLRQIIKEGYKLNRMKGTKAALERLTEIVLEEKVIILEKNMIYNQNIDNDVYESLYGKGNYDVTMLIKSYVPENEKSQLMFLIKQFVPVRCKLNIRFLDECSGLDNHLYMDINTQITENPLGELDVRQVMDGTALLME